LPLGHQIAEEQPLEKPEHVTGGKDDASGGNNDGCLHHLVLGGRDACHRRCICAVENRSFGNEAGKRRQTEVGHYSEHPHIEDVRHFLNETAADFVNVTSMRALINDADQEEQSG